MKRRQHDPPRRPGVHEHDVERSLAGEEGRAAEEITGANLDADEELGTEVGSQSTRMEELSDGDSAEDPDRGGDDAGEDSDAPG